MLDFIRKSKLGVLVRALRNEPLSLIYANAITYLTGKQRYNFNTHTYKQLMESESSRMAEWKGRNHAEKPLISIVLPVFNTDAIYLEQCLQSVFAQTYGNWELCVVDDGSTKEETRQILNKFENQEQIIVARHKESLGISEATNKAISMAKGAYVAFLDHDDLLRKDALDCMVYHINENDAPEVLYSDEDKIDEKNNRSNPHFKTDWNYDLLLSQNYITHFVLVKRALGAKVGWLNGELDGVQDHDFLLKCAAETQSFFHVREVLYHWRMTQNSTAQNSSVKGDLFAKAKQMLENHGRMMGEDFRVERGLRPLTYCVRRHLREMPRIDIIIPFKDHLNLTKACVTSILELTQYSNYHILLIDNNSEEKETLDWLESLEDDRITKTKYSGKFNYSAIINYGVKNCPSDYILLLNNDIKVINPEWLTCMVEHIMRPEVGAVGAKLLYPDNTIQHAGIILGLGGVAGHSHKYLNDKENGYYSRPHLIHEVSACTAACLLVDKKAFHEIKGFNEKHLPIAFNDVDFCLKLRKAGYKIIYHPLAKLYHYESKTRKIPTRGEKGFKERVAEVHYMQRKWGQSLKDDPNYSPYLSKEKQRFAPNV